MKNRLKLIRHTRTGKGYKKYGLFLCKCGTRKEILITSVNTNKTLSCGCIRREQARSNLVVINSKRTKTLYPSERAVWRGLINRCNNKKSQAYKNYGGRGITVCDRWYESFSNFLKDMGEKPSR